MDPALMYSLISFAVGAIVRHFWPTAPVPGGPASPARPAAGAHPLLNSLMAQLNHFLINPPGPGTPGGSSAVNAFLTMLAGMLNASPPAATPIAPPAK